MERKFNKFFYKNEIMNMPNGSAWLLYDSEIENILSKKNDEKANLIFRRIFNIMLYVRCLIKLLYYYLIQFSISKKSYLKGSPFILDVNRGYDYKNIINIKKINKDSINLISAFDFDTYMEFEKVSLSSLYHNFKYLIKCYIVIQESNLPRSVVKIVTQKAQSDLPAFSYLKSFFEILFKKSGGHMYTGGALTTLQIAAHAGFSCSFLHHGLMECYYPGLIRGINSIYVFDKDEKKYLELIGVSSNIKLYEFTMIEKKTRSVVIFSREEAEGVDYKILSDIVDLFLTFDYKIILKPHPRVKMSTKMESWCKSNGVSIIDKSGKKNGTFILKETRPSFTVGILSTVLCESLNMGIIPINAWGDRSDGIIKGMNFAPFNFDTRCLSWKFDQDKVCAALNNKNIYDKHFKLLRK